MVGSVQPILCNRGSDSSIDDNSASTLELDKFTVSGSHVTVNTAKRTDIAIEELDNDIVSYTNEGN